MLTWQCLPFDELSTKEILRNSESSAGRFSSSSRIVPFWMLTTWISIACTSRDGRYGVPTNALAAYARLVPPEVKYVEPSIGRVITSAEFRGQGLGKELMQRAVQAMDELYPGLAIRIGAQQYLERFYSGFGFVTASPTYIEDGIPHVEMVRGRCSARVTHGCLWLAHSDRWKKFSLVP